MPSSRGRIQVLILGDNAGVRDGIRALINGQPDMVVAGDASNCEEGIQKSKTLLPDIVVGEVSHPVASKANMRILSQFTQARVIVISALEGSEWIRQAFDAGVQAVLYQDMLRSELLSAIRTVHGGQQYIPKAIARRLAKQS
jgi:two-component system, NarL family, response regulator